MEEAEHVVESRTRHGVTRVGQAVDPRGRFSQGQVGPEEGDVSSWAHHFLQRRLGCGEDVFQDETLVLVQPLVSRHEVAQLVGGLVRTLGDGVASEHL